MAFEVLREKADITNGKVKRGLNYVTTKGQELLGKLGLQSTDHHGTGPCFKAAEENEHDHLQTQQEILEPEMVQQNEQTKRGEVACLLERVAGPLLKFAERARMQQQLRAPARTYEQEGQATLGGTPHNEQYHLSWQENSDASAGRETSGAAQPAPEEQHRHEQGRTNRIQGATAVEIAAAEGSRESEGDESGGEKNTEDECDEEEEEEEDEADGEKAESEEETESESDIYEREDLEAPGGLRDVRGLAGGVIGRSALTEQEAATAEDEAADNGTPESTEEGRFDDVKAAGALAGVAGDGRDTQREIEAAERECDRYGEASPALEGETDKEENGVDGSESQGLDARETDDAQQPEQESPYFGYWAGRRWAQEGTTQAGNTAAGCLSTGRAPRLQTSELHNILSPLCNPFLYGSTAQHDQQQGRMQPNEELGCWKEPKTADPADHLKGALCKEPEGLKEKASPLHRAHHLYVPPTSADRKYSLSPSFFSSPILQCAETHQTRAAAAAPGGAAVAPQRRSSCTERGSWEAWREQSLNGIVKGSPYASSYEWQEQVAPMRPKWMEPLAESIPRPTAGCNGNADTSRGVVLPTLNGTLQHDVQPLASHVVEKQRRTRVQRQRQMMPRQEAEAQLHEPNPGQQSTTAYSRRFQEIYGDVLWLPHLMPTFASFPPPTSYLLSPCSSPVGRQPPPQVDTSPQQQVLQQREMEGLQHEISEEETSSKLRPEAPCCQQMQNWGLQEVQQLWNPCKLPTEDYVEETTKAAYAQSAALGNNTAAETTETAPKMARCQLEPLPMQGPLHEEGLRLVQERQTENSKHSQALGRSSLPQPEHGLLTEQKQERERACEADGGVAATPYARLELPGDDPVDISGWYTADTQWEGLSSYRAPRLMTTSSQVEQHWTAGEVATTSINSIAEPVPQVSSASLQQDNQQQHKDEVFHVLQARAEEEATVAPLPVSGEGTAALQPSLSAELEGYWKEQGERYADEFDSLLKHWLSYKKSPATLQRASVAEPFNRQGQGDFKDEEEERATQSVAERAAVRTAAHTESFTRRQKLHAEAHFEPFFATLEGYVAPPVGQGKSLSRQPKQPATQAESQERKQLGVENPLEDANLVACGAACAPPTPLASPLASTQSLTEVKQQRRQQEGAQQTEEEQCKLNVLEQKEEKARFQLSLVMQQLKDSYAEYLAELEGTDRHFEQLDDQRKPVHLDLQRPEQLRQQRQQRPHLEEHRQRRQLQQQREQSQQLQQEQQEQAQKGAPDDDVDRYPEDSGVQQQQPIHVDASWRHRKAQQGQQEQALDDAAGEGLGPPSEDSAVEEQHEEVHVEASSGRHPDADDAGSQQHQEQKKQGRRGEADEAADNPTQSAAALYTLRVPPPEPQMRLQSRQQRRLLQIQIEDGKRYPGPALLNRLQELHDEHRNDLEIRELVCPMLQMLRRHLEYGQLQQDLLEMRIAESHRRDSRDQLLSWQLQEAARRLERGRLQTEALERIVSALQQDADLQMAARHTARSVKRGDTGGRCSCKTLRRLHSPMSRSGQTCFCNNKKGIKPPVFHLAGGSGSLEEEGDSSDFIETDGATEGGTEEPEVLDETPETRRRVTEQHEEAEDADAMSSSAAANNHLQQAQQQQQQQTGHDEGEEWRSQCSPPERASIRTEKELQSEQPPEAQAHERPYRLPSGASSRGVVPSPLAGGSSLRSVLQRTCSDQQEASEADDLVSYAIPYISVDWSIESPYCHKPNTPSEALRKEAHRCLLEPCEWVMLDEEPQWEDTYADAFAYNDAKDAPDSACEACAARLSKPTTVPAVATRAKNAARTPLSSSLSEHQEEQEQDELLLFHQSPNRLCNRSGDPSSTDARHREEQEADGWMMLKSTLTNTAKASLASAQTAAEMRAGASRVARMGFDSC